MESRRFFLAEQIWMILRNNSSMSQKTILIANPYLENCYLTDALIDSANSQTQINIVTRMPEMKEIREKRMSLKTTESRHNSQL